MEFASQKKEKRPAYMVCSICGKEIQPYEDYDYSQSRRKTFVYWHRDCYRKKEEHHG